MTLNTLFIRLAWVPLYLKQKLLFHRSFYSFIITLCLNVFFSSQVLANTTSEKDKQNISTLRLPIVSENIPQEFNPFDSRFDDLVKGTLFEPLVAFNTLTGETHFRLAEDYFYSSDLLKLTYKLRDNLKWSNGKPLTAEDVVFSFYLAQKHESIDVGGLWRDGTLKSVEAEDQQTVVLNFNRINTTADWLIPQYYIVPKHVWSKVKDPMSYENPIPVGSGPITEILHSRPDSLQMCKNPFYYRENEPYIDCIEYKAMPNVGDQQKALIAGEIDWGAGFVANVEKSYIALDEQHHGYWYPPEGLINLYFNTRQKPLSELSVRQAISMALDRETIVDLAAYGYPTTEKHVVGIGLLYRSYFNPSINKKYDYLSAYLPNRSKTLLDKAGYIDRDGDGFRELPNGKPMSISILAVAGWPDWEQAIQMVSEYLVDIGINAYAKPVSWDEYDQSLKQGTYDIAMNWTSTGVDPIITYKDYYHSSRIGKSWQAGHGINSREVDRWINEYSQTQSPDKRAEILDKLMLHTAQKLPFIPLWSNPTWFQYNSKYIVGWPTAENPHVNPWFFDGISKLLLFSQLKPREEK